MIPTHQIWSYDVHKKQISKRFYFVLILHLISGKVTKYLVEKLSTSKVISQKLHGGWKPPPSAFRVKFLASVLLSDIPLHVKLNPSVNKILRLIKLHSIFPYYFQKDSP